MDCPCRASGEEICPNRSTSGFYCFKMTFPGGPRKIILDWEKIVDPRFWVFKVAAPPPRKITPPCFLLHLSVFQRFHLFCAPREFHETLLYVEEVRKVPFRVRRPGARIGLSPRRNSRSALPRAIPVFAFFSKRFPGSSVLCETRSWRGPEFSEIHRLRL